MFNSKEIIQFFVSKKSKQKWEKNVDINDWVTQSYKETLMTATNRAINTMSHKLQFTRVSQILPANHSAASTVNHACCHHQRPIAVQRACAVATMSRHGKANVLWHHNQHNMWFHCLLTTVMCDPICVTVTLLGHTGHACSTQYVNVLINEFFAWGITTDCNYFAVKHKF